MEGIAEAIQTIAKMAKNEMQTTTLNVTEERKGVYYLVGPDGIAEKKVADPAWHAEKLGAPSDLRSFIENNNGGDGAVFYGEAGITYVYSLSDRRDSATCHLIQSPQYKMLCAPLPQMRQAEFVRFLRITCKGILPPDGNLLGIVRNLKFSTAGEGGANIQHGRESIGRSLQSQVSGESAIPEEIRLMVQVFENFPFVTPVSCAIEVFPQEQLLQLTPYPLEVRRAMDGAMDALRELFAGEDMPPVYRGNP